MSQTTVPRASATVQPQAEPPGRPAPGPGIPGLRLPDLPRPGRGWLPGLRTAGLLLPLLAALVWGAVTYGQETRAAVLRTGDNVALVRQYAERLIQTQTILHAAAYERARSEPAAFLRSGEFQRFLAGLERSQDFLLGLEVLEFDGTRVASAAGLRAPPDEGARAAPGDGLRGAAPAAPPAYLDAIRSGAPIFVDRVVPDGSEAPATKGAGGGTDRDAQAGSGQPERGAEAAAPGAAPALPAPALPAPAAEADVLVVATPLRMAGFEGVIVSTVATATVTDFLRGIVVGEDETASLLREDGMLLMRSLPSRPMLLGPDAPGMRAIREADRGTFRAVARTDGIDRLYAFDRLANLPLYANFGTPAAIVQENWLARVWPVWALLGALGLFAFLGLGFLERGLAARAEGAESARRLREAETLAVQRTRLLHEMNHRIKNNLSLVVSMISLQMRQEGEIDGPALKARIRAISEVHDLLYQSEDGVRADLGRVLTGIASSPAIVPKERGIAVVCNLEHGIMLGPEKTTPLAIVAAELMVNAVKHAFPGRSDGRISLRLRREADGAHATLTLRDNGIGLLGSSARRSGGAIVAAFAEQIGGRLETSSDGGAVFRLTFPLDPPGTA